MTIPTMLGIETALRGLQANQAALDTTGENITNASTPGYSRQRVDLTESDALTIPALSNVTGTGAQVGTGVDISNITRVRDAFIDIQYRTQNTSTSNANTLASELGQVQTALGSSSSDAISTALSNFWNSWSTLANNPSGSSQAAALQSVVDNGTTLAQTFNAVSAQMATVQSQASQQYATLTGAGGQVQQDANQIATLNQQIVDAQAAGTTPNDLLDQRDNLIDDLSSLASVTVTTQSNGSDTISFGNAAQPLIGGATGTTVTWPQAMTSAAGGQLGALLNLGSATGPIGTLSSQLDTVANTVISSVNALQPTSPFFSGNSASTIAVSATTATIQTSSSATSGTDLAQGIAALSGGAADQGYAAFVASMGDTVASANSAQTTAQSVLTAIDNQRQSVSGVSLDEEMANLITFQRGYQASARMMQAMNDTLQTLISSTTSAGM
jgi:flagellar hook-associated protein 1